jgi:hypothetical protein
MTANPIDAVGGIATTANVVKADISGWAKARVPQVMADATEVRNTLLLLQLVIVIKAMGTIYIQDTADTTTLDDGFSCIISSDGKRFKAVSVVPAPTTGSLGGIFASAAVTHQYVTGLDTSGNLLRLQPSLSDLTDVITGKSTDGTFASNSDTLLPTQKAVKTYVDTVAQGLDPKQSVLVATTANLTLSGEQTIDGILTSASRILVKNQTTASQNGIYITAAGAWARSLDADTWAELPGAFVFVEQGTVNDNTGWTCTVNAGGTLGTTAVTFVQFSGAGTFTAGTNITLTGSVFSLGTLSGTIAGTPTLSGANFITRANLAQVAASSLSGNPTGTLANESGITLGSTLNFSSTTLNATTATGAQLGVVKPDGTTITVSAGVLTAVGAAATSVAVGTTTISSGTSGDLLYDNGGTLGNLPMGSLFSSSVTGGSTTYAAAQAGFNVERSNSGTAVMTDTLPGTGTAVLPANSVVTVTNADASASLAISAASGALIKGGRAINGFLYLGPGQTVQIQSDGSNYWPISVPTRIKMAANTTIFVATTGSDTASHGLTTGSAFLTTNHAWAFAQNSLDLNGFVLTIQHATGTYASTIQLNGRMVGQNGPASVLIQGDLVTPANVVFPGVGSTTSVVADFGAQFQIQGVQISSASSQGLAVRDSGSVVNIQTINFGATSGAAITAVTGGTLRVVGSYAIVGSEGVHWNASAGGQITIEAAATITISASLTWATSFAFAQSVGVIIFDFSPTFAGAGAGTGSTGVRWGANSNGVITTGGATLPGTVGGTALTGGQFS